MAETVIMLPVFILVWGFIAYMHDAHVRATNNAAQVRQAAWSQALASCGGGPPSGSVTTSSGGYSATGMMQAANSMGRAAVTTLPSARGAWPGISFREVTAEGSDTAQRPSVLGSGNVQLSHKVTLTCNERPNTSVNLDDMAMEAWLIYGYGGS